MLPVRDANDNICSNIFIMYEKQRTLSTVESVQRNDTPPKRFAFRSVLPLENFEADILNGIRAYSATQ